MEVTVSHSCRIIPRNSDGMVMENCTRRSVFLVISALVSDFSVIGAAAVFVEVDFFSQAVI